MRALEYIDARIRICFIQCLVSMYAIVNEGEVRMYASGSRYGRAACDGEMNNWGEFANNSRERDEVECLFFLKKSERTAGATFVKGELNFGIGNARCIKQYQWVCSNPPCGLLIIDFWTRSDTGPDNASR